jgi:heat shock protein HslJ
MRRAIAILLAGVALGLLGCASGDDASDLEDIRWKMSAYAVDGEMVDALDDASVTAAFDGSAVSGSGGCNSYNGSYVAEGSAIEIGPAAATLMACPEPIMAQEQAFFAALSEAAEYQVTETELTLLDEDGDETLRFEAE